MGKAVKVLQHFFWDNLLSPIIDAIYPPLCHLCDEYLPRHRKVVCAACLHKLPQHIGKIDDIKTDRHFNQIHIVYEFSTEFRVLVHLLKYKRFFSLAEYFAREAALLLPQLKEMGYQAIIPVPLHKSRLRERGYNQSAELAKYLSPLLSVPCYENLLLRRRVTKTQTKLNREEREANVRNAFFCPGPLAVDNVLLIDDVVTTGSTANACCRVLLEAGAKKIDLLALANPTMQASAEESAPL